jgi:DNA (cytosine-5)-methyltransferase 1
MVKPTVISTFAGAGGSSEGYRQAGYDERLAVEWDAAACETFRLNFPGVPVFQGDIGKLTGPQALKLAGLEKGQLDVLDGSPPCQGFSTAGKRKLHDDRNGLFKQYARLLRALQPRAFVMENVAGMIRGHMRPVYLMITKTLRESGYEVAGALMNSEWFGVPQARPRVIVIGIRKDLGITPSHPAPEQKQITVRTAFEGCPDYMPAPPMGDGKIEKGARLIAPGRTLADVTGSWGHGIRRLREDRPSFTLKKLARFGAPCVIHPTEMRGLSIGEARRLGGFPDSFSFDGQTYEQAWAQIGNSVPPPLMRAVARHVHALLEQPVPA